MLGYIHRDDYIRSLMRKHVRVWLAQRDAAINPQCLIRSGEFEIEYGIRQSESSLNPNKSLHVDSTPFHSKSIYVMRAKMLEISVSYVRYIS